MTTGLALAGALAGAVCGVLALVPLVGRTDASFAALAAAAPPAAAVGAAFGVFWGPFVAWTLLPHVPLWRVILWVSAGTVLGAFCGWAAAGPRLELGLPALFGGALIGMAIAGVVLRRRVARAPSGSDRGAAT